MHGARHSFFREVSNLNFDNLFKGSFFRSGQKLDTGGFMGFIEVMV